MSESRVQVCLVILSTGLNVSYFLLDAGPFWIVLPFSGTLLCHCITFFYDSEMHVDAIINVCVGHVDWKPHGREHSSKPSKNNGKSKE